MTPTQEMHAAKGREITRLESGPKGQLLMPPSLNGQDTKRHGRRTPRREERQEGHLTKHALDRSTARSIPLGVIDLIVAYGESCPARDGGRKYGLSKDSIREIKHDFGREIAKTLQPYRKAYVVMCEGWVVTVAYARQPHFH